MNLRTAIHKRLQEYWSWDLLGTAVGIDASVMRTVHRLSAAHLNTFPWEGPGNAPSQVGEHVQALAAYSPVKLADLAQTWPSPHEMDENPWFLRAWYTSLPYLKKLGVIEREQVDVPDLAREVTILWDAPTQPTFSWRALARDLAEHPNLFAIDRIRALDGAMMVESSLSAADLEGIPWEMWRALLGRGKYLDASARDVVEGIARHYFHTEQPNIFAVEVCKELDIPVIEPLQTELVEAVNKGHDPQTLTGITYALVTPPRTP